MSPTYPEAIMAARIGKITRRQKQDGSTQFILDFRPHGRIYSIPTPTGPIPLTEETASRVLESIRADVARGKSVQRAVGQWLRQQGSDLLLLNKAKRWLEHLEAKVAAGDLSPTYVCELDRYVTHAGYLAQWWQGRAIDSITYADLEDFNSWLAKQGGASGKGLSAKTRQSVLGALHALMKWLRRRGDLTAEEMPEFPTVTVGEYSPTIIDRKTQDKVLATIEYERRGAFLACRLGVRPGEVRALNIVDYSLDDDGQGWLTIARAFKGQHYNAPIRSTKERNVRAIPVDAELAAWIAWRIKNTSKRLPLPALFPNPTAVSENAERRWEAGTLRKEWNRSAKRVGVKVKMYEGTKHSFASDAVRRGISLEMIQKFLGHADRRSTEKYAKLAGEGLVKVLRN